MSENTTTPLVPLTFQGEERMVYPEIVEFFAARRKAEADYNLATFKRQADRSAYIAAKAAEWYAQGDNEGSSFDSYAAGTEFDRQVSDRHEEETRYTDAIQGSRRNNRRGNPNLWDKLRQDAEAAGHKEVVWIVDSCLEYEHEALILLHYLPADPETLWDLAKNRHDMCQVFDNFMQQAETLGLFTNGKMPAGIRELHALQSYVRRTYGSSYVREITRHTTRIMKAIQEDYDARLAEAKAEWQRLDEARAESASRNRSEAAKAAWERRKAEAEAVKADVSDDDLSAEGEGESSPAPHATVTVA